MTTVAVGSARSSPGVTTTVLALAAAWPPERRLVIVEADPAGGELACRWGLMAEPTLVTMAADGRAVLTVEALLAHCQHLPGRPGVEVAAAPVDPRQAKVALSVLARAGLAELLASEADVDILVDVGRLEAGSPSLELFGAAGSALLVARSDLVQAAHLRERIAWVGAGGGVELVVVGQGQWSPAELAAGVGASGVAGVLPEDARGAAALVSGPGARGLQRSALFRAAGPIVAHLLAKPVPATGRTSTGMAERRSAAEALVARSSLSAPTAVTGKDMRSGQWR
ncbi:MAG TPA: hypothetical protein VFJ85_01235 [Acidimicrobiales bacterium]|nr:hypothetical protein [Acidimicrobiales bacterium]